MLRDEEIEHFITNGFVRIDDAFSKDTADKAVDTLWNDIPYDRSDPSTWTAPVVRLGMYAQPPFVESINTPRLHSAFNQLVGEGRWIPCRSVGTFPVRFPSAVQPNDNGKHVDASFPGNDPNNYFEWRINVTSKGRALLMLVLYSDVGEHDAPTIIDKGSHIDVAKLLREEGDDGLSFMELASKVNELPVHGQAMATGKAGTVYLCHPFIVHAAQGHRGINPKFMAQPPLLLKGELSPSNTNGVLSPVEKAIRMALID